MSQLYMLCGFIGSGKTTYAKKIEKNEKAIRFSMDEWMIPLFGESMSRIEFHERHSFFEEKFKEIAIQLLNNNQSVIFDFGFWTKEHRSKFYEWANENEINIKRIFLSTDMNTCKERAIKRSESHSKNSYIITESMFNELKKLFEKPSENEYDLRIS
ncbi:AAA family ATPase [Photobacterium galatheae]|uniref:ATP-binding protein n=1 Tax=Photobacterium galatheae TaxID=1654360 RepID=A0A066RQN8_9GAMM|nr:ATP-binding protein [Photobacterium galatheae]KDM90012.1 hypothetical protein EA58_18895 [Photobacterium galatheae]MCM0149993.1 ATP-binding protein [Photobacterium galatheae]